MMHELSLSAAAELKTAPFGARLQSAREALHLETKEVAAQLRLNEKFILMMESEQYPADLPVTFIRGYIRAYGKLLHLSEQEIKQAIEPIKPKPGTEMPLITTRIEVPSAIPHYFMKGLTWIILLTLISLVAMWWYNHSSPASLAAESQRPIMEKPSAQSGINTQTLDVNDKNISNNVRHTSKPSTIKKKIKKAARSARSVHRASISHENKQVALLANNLADDEDDDDNDV